MSLPGGDNRYRMRWYMRAYLVVTGEISKPKVSYDLFSQYLTKQNGYICEQHYCTKTIIIFNNLHSQYIRNIQDKIPNNSITVRFGNRKRRCWASFTGGRGCIIFPPLFEKPCDTLAIQRLYGILYNIQYTLVLRIRIRPLVFLKYKNRQKKDKQKHCYVQGLFIVQS